MAERARDFIVCAWRGVATKWSVTARGMGMRRGSIPTVREPGLAVAPPPTWGHAPVRRGEKINDTQLTVKYHGLH